MSEPAPDASSHRGRPVDADTLKAFAHPLRMRMYDYLKDHGAATATMLAREMGESTGQTSYHLRQLERHGLVSEDVGRGAGRERWWQSEGFSFGLDAAGSDPEALSAMDLVQRRQVEERARRQLEWIDRAEQEDPDWRAVVTFNEVTIRLTPRELEVIREDLAEVLEQHLDRARAARREHGDEGTRMVKLYSMWFPLPPEEQP